MRRAELSDTPAQLTHGLIYRPEFIARAEGRDLLDAIAPLPFREARLKKYFAKRSTSFKGPYGEIGKTVFCQPRLRYSSTFPTRAEEPPALG
jgi:hypothetical protein